MNYKRLGKSLRLMSLVFMNIDFSSLEVLEKINRIQILHDIAFDLRENFVLPENEKIKSDSLISNDVPVYYPSIEECKTVLGVFCIFPKSKITNNRYYELQIYECSFLRKFLW